MYCNLKIFLLLIKSVELPEGTQINCNSQNEINEDSYDALNIIIVSNNYLQVC